MAQPTAKLRGITIDVSDLGSAESFWSRVLDLEVRHREGAYVWFDEVAPGIVLILQQVSDEKIGKNRVHLEIAAEEPVALIDAIERWGGTRVEDVEADSFALTVMADPDGNEFCVARLHSPFLASSARMP